MRRNLDFYQYLAVMRLPLRDLWDYKKELACVLLVSQKEKRKWAGLNKYLMK